MRDEVAAKLFEDPEAFYDWAVRRLDLERAAWYRSEEYRSPYRYGATRTPR